MVAVVAVIGLLAGFDHGTAATPSTTSAPAATTYSAAVTRTVQSVAKQSLLLGTRALCARIKQDGEDHTLAGVLRAAKARGMAPAAAAAARAAAERGLRCSP